MVVQLSCTYLQCEIFIFLNSMRVCSVWGVRDTAGVKTQVHARAEAEATGKRLLSAR